MSSEVDVGGADAASLAPVSIILVDFSRNYIFMHKRVNANFISILWHEFLVSNISYKFSNFTDFHFPLTL